MENECAKYDLELSSMLCKSSVCAQYKHLKVENWPMKQCLEFNRINILLILTAGILVRGGLYCCHFIFCNMNAFRQEQHNIFIHHFIYHLLKKK